MMCTSIQQNIFYFLNASEIVNEIVNEENYCK